ncbi:MAG TPA: hypothetical protein VF920_08445 [Dongiaceae bacterium]
MINVFITTPCLPAGQAFFDIINDEMGWAEVAPRIAVREHTIRWPPEPADQGISLPGNLSSRF